MLKMMNFADQPFLDQVSKNDELCIKNEKLCIKNEEFVFKMMNFQGGKLERVVNSGYCQLQ